jgi:O-antigen biosynthesis protein
MEFTGERFMPTERGRIRLEHYHRYAIVQQVVTGKAVLDVACGEGYGSSFMAEVATSVIGVDISAEAVQHASSTYKKSNLEFLQGSATQLDFGNATFDVVVSFETIEHLLEQAQMLSEIRRVLRPDGFLIISSPNRPIYSEESGEHNEFHVKELDFVEFDQLLRAQFLRIQYSGQRMLMGSVIQPLEENASAFIAWNDDGVSLRPNSGHLTDPVYFMAICGSGAAALPRLDASVLYPDKLDLIKHYVGFAKWAQSQDQIVAERAGQVAFFQQAVAEREGQIASLNHAVAERDGQIAFFHQAAAEQGGQVAFFQQAVAEREGQIASLKRSVDERDGQIAFFHQAAAERGGQIAFFHQAAAERDGKIASLNFAVAESDGKIASLNYAVAERDGKIVSLKHVVTERDGQMTYLANAVEKNNENLLRLEGMLNEERAQLQAMQQSTSWRITLPLREARTWMASPKQQVKRYIKWSIRLTKRMYQVLPLTDQSKAKHKNVLAKYFPRLLSASGGHLTAIPAQTLLVIKPMLPDITTNPAKFTKTIQIPLAPNPMITVIIPVYGQIDYTLRCLASIEANPAQVAFEVIVVDDCSPDNSAEMLSRVNGIRLIRNGKNQGFIRSCNAGARAAQGEYLYFLNNDTEVTPGWIDELVRTFEEFPGTGFAGSKLVYPDGRLQEAGGIVWQDGSAWNFGRCQDPQLPIYNYAREVDYCSGASIMVPKVLFDELGGFDEHYLPAYCEDCDLALKIRDKGYRVIYQPLSTVIHFEGVTSGTDTSKGTKAYQVENTKKLYERWKSRLQTHQPAGMDADNAKDRMATSRVLVIDHCTPTANQDAGSLITFNMLLLLREMNFQVTFIPENDFLYQPEYTTALQRAGIEVLYAPYVTSVEQHLKEYGGRYALAFLFRPVVFERHFDSIQQYCPQAKVLFHTVDLHFLRMSREAMLQKDETKQQAADDMKRLELSAIRASHASIVVSTAELELLRPELPTAKLHVFPLIMDVRGTSKSFASRRDIVFVGGYQHVPNVDAVKYFVAEIMPLLRSRLPGVRFHVVGSKTPAELQALACEDVVIRGFVDDLAPLLDKMRVSVAPIRYGAGIKGKIGSAMAVGLPVVATPLAAEGMLLVDDESILVAEGAEQFADAVVKLYQDELLWNRISQHGLKFAEHAWGAETAWQALHAILDELGVSSTRGAYPLSLYASLDAQTTRSWISAHRIRSNASRV